MILILFARIILFFDKRVNFINENYIATLRTLYVNREDLRFLSHREFYALFLFWQGLEPNPKLHGLRNLNGNYSWRLRLGYRFFRTLLDLIGIISGKQQPTLDQTKRSISSNFFYQTKPVHSLQFHDSKLTSTSIVIPIYNAYEYTKQCIESVLETCPGVDLLLIDDCSTDSDLIRYLADLEKSRKVRLMKNSENLGFVKSANKGMANCGENDVILLNSDTIVFEGWAESLQTWKHGYEDVATVTAMSNAATIYSLPFSSEFDCSPELTSIMSTALRYSNSKTEKVEIPTCHGFCVLISREAINKIGLFDEVTFGMGYGEENDFSLRAVSVGMKNLLATNVVIHHFASKSFGNHKDKVGQENLSKLVSKYPRYLNQIESFVGSGSLDQLRLKAFKALFDQGALRQEFHISHNLKGGVDKSIKIETSNRDAATIILRPSKGSNVNLTVSLKEHVFETYIAVEDEYEIVDRISDFFNVKEIFIQHLIGFSEKFIEGLLDSKPTKTLRIHDYFYICPRIHLSGTDYIDCGLPDIGRCNKCLLNDFTIDIETWRLQKSRVLSGVDVVTAPSLDTINRYRKIHPNLSLERYAIDEELPSFQLTEHSDVGVRRICIIGELTPHKGLFLIQELLDKSPKFPLHFDLIGTLPSGVQINHKQIKIHGRYANYQELKNKLVELSPDAIFFPNRVPETYSYVLTEALSLNLPIFYFATGAIKERMNNRELGIEIPLDADSETILSILISEENYVSRNHSQ